MLLFCLPEVERDCYLATQYPRRKHIFISGKSANFLSITNRNRWPIELEYPVNQLIINQNNIN
jgi:hypothetical protein